MANSSQARKRARQADKRRSHNASLRSMFRTSIKKVQKAVDAGNKDEAADAFKRAVPMIDTMVNKGIIHKNKAARHKSRLNGHIQAM